MGRKLAVNGYPLEIAGIAEKGFGGIFNGSDADVFVPLTMYPMTTPSAARVWDTPNMSWLVTMARLKPGISMQQAQAGMQVLWPRVVDAVNDTAAKAGRATRTFKEDPIKLAPGARATSYWANANAGPSGDARVRHRPGSAHRLRQRGEPAALARRRKAEGDRHPPGDGRDARAPGAATPGREPGPGGGRGSGRRRPGVVGRGAALPVRVLNPDFRFRPSLVVLASSVVLTMLTGVLFGLAPAFRATRITLAETIKESGSASQGRSRLRIGKALVVGQVALSLALLVGAGLFLRTLRNLQNADLGFQRENVLVVDIDPTNLGLPGAPPAHVLRSGCWSAHAAFPACARRACPA
jgi:hypothetical protein